MRGDLVIALNASLSLHLTETDDRKEGRSVFEQKEISVGVYHHFFLRDPAARIQG